MKLKFSVFVLFTASISTISQANSQASSPLPATPLVCESKNGNFKLEAIIHRSTGDLYENTLKIYEKGVQKSPEIKQYRNYQKDIFIVASLGREEAHDEVGYIIELEEHASDRTKLKGYAEKYIIDPLVGTRDEQRGTLSSLFCQFRPL